MNPQKPLSTQRELCYLWTPVGNCSLINDINPHKSVLQWQHFCPSPAKHQVNAFGTKETVSSRRDGSEIHPKAGLHIPASLSFLIKGNIRGEKNLLHIDSRLQDKGK